MAMLLVANVTGGGADGKLGLDQVFAGLINNLALVNINAAYLDSTATPPGPASVSVNRYVSNAASATGSFGGKPMFQPGDPAPLPLAWPILDSGRPSAGTGGETATMTASVRRRWTTVRQWVSAGR